MNHNLLKPLPFSHIYMFPNVCSEYFLNILFHICMKQYMSLEM